MKIYLYLEEEERGPFSRSEIFALMKEGSVLSETWARWEGKGDWVPVKDLLAVAGTGLFSVEQIARQQEERPAQPVIIPEMAESRRNRPDFETESGRSHNRHLLLLLAGLVFVAIGAGALFFSRSEEVDPTVATAVSTPTPEPRKRLSSAQPAKIAVSPTPMMGPLPRSTPTEELERTLEPRVAEATPTPTPQALPGGNQNQAMPVRASYAASWEDFFSIGAMKITFVSLTTGKVDVRPTPVARKKPDEKIPPEKEEEIAPCVEVKIRAKGRVKGSGVYAKAYFYDRQGKCVEEQPEPLPVLRGGYHRYAMPAVFLEGQSESVYLPVPLALRKVSGWKALVVFGDQDGADAKVYPSGTFTSYRFAERAAVESPKPVKRQEVADTLVEYVVYTKNAKQPQITLFLRPPLKMTNLKEAKGVLAICLLADRVEDVKRRLLSDGDESLGWALKYAEKRQLAILCWGARSGLWDKSKSWDELPVAEQKEINRNFEQVSQGWVAGVKELARKYGIPEKGFLLTGESASGQYAMRLALRCPEMFLATFIHIPSSFDRPTPQANRVLWCLTTGDFEAGYERSIRFYQQCRELGYPIIYKAISGLGHSSSPLANRVGEAFFEWALQERPEREALDRELADKFSPVAAQWKKNPLKPWPALYRSPPYVGDLLYQGVVPVTDRDMVPEELQVPLPEPKLAEAWNKAGRG